MDYVMEWVTGLLLDQQGNKWIVIVILSGAVFILAFALMSLLDDFFDPVRSRFNREVTVDLLSVLESDKLSDKLRKHNNMFVPSDKSLLQRTATRLNYAGFHGKNSLLHYYAIRMLLLILLPLIVLMVSVFFSGIKGAAILQGLLAAAALGYLGPSLILDHLITNRQKNLQRAFPDALDLLVVCSEAGLSLDAGLQKVAAEINISQPILADELAIVIAETRVGIERHKALQRLVERTGVEEIKGLLSTLAQSMQFGTSIAETLKVYSEDLRDKRMQTAEEKAAKIGTKLIFPLVLCLLPAFLIVVMAPAFMMLKKLGSL